MKGKIDLKEEITSCKSYGYKQHEVVEHLKNLGFSMEEIKAEMLNVESLVSKESIVKSLSFVFTTLLFGLLSLAPLLGYISDSGIYYGLGSLFLCVTTFGYFKLMKVSVIIWLSILGLVELYLLAALVTKLCGVEVTSLYTYPFTVSLILFISALIRSTYTVFEGVRELSNRYKF